MFNRVGSFGRRLFMKMSGDTKPTIVFVLGAPGSGKGTQCEKIVQEFGYVHLSAGDLLRGERNTPGSQYGELIETHIRNGTIVPVEITCRLIDTAMRRAGSSHFLIDGFPRNQNNMDGWNREMSQNVDLRFILFFCCDQNVCIDRCLKRGQAGSGRSDDNIDSLKKRFDTYFNDTMPIIDFYEQKNLVRKVDAGLPPDEVFEKVKEVFVS